MFMVYLVFIMSLFLIRLIAGYDSRYQKGNYIIVKNTFLCKVLLSRTSLREKTKRPQKDRNKMSVWGIVFYAAAGVVLLVSLFFLFVDDIPIEPWVIDATELYIYADTLNEKVSAIVVLLLLALVVGYTVFRLLGLVKETKPKWVKIFVWVWLLLALFSAVALSGYFLFELLSCFL